MSPDKRGRLIQLLAERSFERRKVILASGKESDFFIDCKQTMLTAEGHALVGELMFDLLSLIPECEAVGGVELGGCPLASAVSLVSFQRGRPLNALYVRKAKKDHGTTKLVEGDKSLKPGLKVALLEDVVTTGGSSLKAVESLKEAGAQVVGAEPPAPAASFARSLAFSTLPMVFRGSSVATSMRFGILKLARLALSSRRIASASGRVSGSGTTTATTASPRSSSGIPTTALSLMPGSRSRAASTSVG